MSAGTHIFLYLLTAILSALAGGAIGAVFSFKKFNKQIKDKPLISSSQIKQLFSQTGHTLSEKRCNQLVREFNRTH